MSNVLAAGVRLAVVMLIFAFVGFLSTPSLVSLLYGYDHGMGESELVGVTATVGGALIGVMIHVWPARSNRG
jgi:hypothetical protein